MRMDPSAPTPPEPDLGDDERTLAKIPAAPSSGTLRSHQPPPPSVAAPGSIPRPPGSGSGARGPGSSAGKRARARRCPTCQQAFSGEARFCPFDGDLLLEAPDWNPSADPLIGQVVEGRYEVASVIGEGGMGTVYEVRHTSLGRRFALKVLRRDIADAEHTARFIQEAKAAAAIGHPNIVAVSDFGELMVSSDAAPASGGAGPTSTQPVPYFVMEYLTGISLAALLRADKTLEPARAAQIVLQCASGLAAAHAAGVIHRDLKPDNVFLSRTGDREFVKLLDFGVAKMAGAGRLTRAGMVFGTPHYMSPEQAAGQNVDHRADIYALGVILYECLTGRVPFEADTYMGVLTKHMFATPEPIDRLVPASSRLGALGPIAMRCLQKDPHDRYASMAEVVAAIEQALADAAAPKAKKPRKRLFGRDRADSADVVSTPMLRPVVGPVGVGLGVLAVALVVLLVAHELRSQTVEAGQPSALPTASAPVAATSTASTGAPPPVAETAGTAGSTAPTVTPPTARPDEPTAGTARPRPGSTRPRMGDLPRKGGGRSGDMVDPWGNK
jgi:serine/threonine protein kinase